MVLSTLPVSLALERQSLDFFEPIDARVSRPQCFSFGLVALAPNRLDFCLNVFRPKLLPYIAGLTSKLANRNEPHRADLKPK